MTEHGVKAAAVDMPAASVWIPNEVGHCRAGAPPPRDDAGNRKGRLFEERVPDSKTLQHRIGFGGQRLAETSAVKTGAVIDDYAPAQL
jgi:hypothetical protein